MVKVKEKTKVLVTGGAGFIGRHVCRSLINKGYQIIVFDNFSNSSRQGLDNMCEIIEGDIRDKNALTNALCQVDHVVHLAALVSVPASIMDPSATFDVNVNGTENMLLGCVSENVTGRIVYASSAAVYGNHSSKCVVEADATGTQLLSPYAASKYTNEIQAQTYNRCYDLNAVGLRFFNVYGEGQDPDSPYSGVISKMLQAHQSKNMFTIFGDGEASRDYVSVEDIAYIIAELISGSEVLPAVMNAGTGVESSLNDLIAIWHEDAEKSFDYQYGDIREGDIQHSCANIDLLRSVLPAWQPKTIQSGLVQWLNGAVAAKSLAS